MIASTNRSLTLVQGPPGTGKTAVALEILKYWSESQQLNQGKNSSLLACSDSNVAVDNLVEGLIKEGVKVVRVGRPENTRPELLQYSTSVLVEQQIEKQAGYSLVGKHSKTTIETKSDASNQKHNILTRILREADVICATCIGAGSSLLDNINFAGVLIDEASQATELSTLVPLMHECQQLVLVGDHCQLPPTVPDDDAQYEGKVVKKKIKKKERHANGAL